MLLVLLCSVSQAWPLRGSQALPLQQWVRPTNAQSSDIGRAGFVGRIASRGRPCRKQHRPTPAECLAQL
jgi:hypothetical protein